jgi:hypothetical protein
MLRYLFFLLITILCITKVNAQNEVYSDSTVPITEEKVVVDDYEDEDYDINKMEQPPSMPGWGEEVFGDTLVNFRYFEISEDSIKNLKNSTKYEWVKTLDSTLRQLQKKQENKPVPEPSKNYDNSTSALDHFFNSTFLKIFLWLAAAGFVIFIIYNLFLSKGIFTKTGNRVVKELEEEESIDHLDNDFDILFEKALDAGDTRLAMRYLFLKTLQKLNDKEHIQYAVDKTNSIYAREMPATLRNKFAQIAMFYEYSWYGNTAIPTQAFDSIKNTVNSFTNNL